jgi:hypothetical protein
MPVWSCKFRANRLLPSVKNPHGSILNTRTISEVPFLLKQKNDVSMENRACFCVIYLMENWENEQEMRG